MMTCVKRTIIKTLYLEPDNPIARDSTTYMGIKNTIGIALLEGFNKYAKAGFTAFASYKISKYTLNEYGGESIARQIQ